MASAIGIADCWRLFPRPVGGLEAVFGPDGQPIRAARTAIPDGAGANGDAVGGGPLPLKRDGDRGTRQARGPVGDGRAGPAPWRWRALRPGT